MKIGSLGYNYAHDETFIMDRPNGPGCYLMLIIKTPALVSVNNREYTVSENSFIIFSPDTPCRYRGNNGGYTDDWVYFEVSDSDLELFSKLGIPLDTPLKLGNTEELEEIIHILAYEHYSAEIYREEIEQHYTKIFLYKLSRCIRSGMSISTNMYTEKNHRMTQLRAELFNRPDNVMTVDEMAQSVNMSRSSFQHLYKKMFGASVMKDVTKGRIERAKRLLSSTNLTVNEIAVRCGYSNEFNFMRRFRNVCGQTPTEYRKCTGAK